MLRSMWTSEGMVMEDVDPGPLAPGRVRINVTACGICGSDLHVYAGRSTRHNNVVMGHEIVGTIIEGGARPPRLPLRHRASGRLPEVQLLRRRGHQYLPRHEVHRH